MLPVPRNKISLKLLDILKSECHSDEMKILTKG